MTVHINGSKGKELYYNGVKIKEAYYNGNKVYSSKPLYMCYYYAQNPRYYYVKEENGSYKLYAKSGYGIATSSSELAVEFWSVISSVTESQLVLQALMGSSKITCYRSKNNDLYT